MEQEINIEKTYQIYVETIKELEKTNPLFSSDFLLTLEEFTTFVEKGEEHRNQVFDEGMEFLANDGVDVGEMLMDIMEVLEKHEK